MHQKRRIISSLKLKFWRRSLPATFTFVSVMLGGMFYLILTPRRYQATAQLILEPKSNNIAEVDSDLSAVSERLLDRHLSLRDRAKSIESEKILQIASSNVNNFLRTTKASPSKSEGASLQSRIITPKQIATNLKVKAISRNNILQIDYQDRSPQTATMVADAIAKAAILENEKNINAEIQSLKKFLEVEIAKQQENNSVDGDRKSQEKLQFLQNKLEEVYLAKADLLSRLKILNLANNSDPLTEGTSPASLSDGIPQSISENQTRRKVTSKGSSPKGKEWGGNLAIPNSAIGQSEETSKSLALDRSFGVSPGFYEPRSALHGRSRILVYPNPSLVMVIAVSIASLLSLTIVQLLEVFDTSLREDYDNFDDWDFDDFYLEKQDCKLIMGKICDRLARDTEN